MIYHNILSASVNNSAGQRCPDSSDSTPETPNCTIPPNLQRDSGDYLKPLRPLILGQFRGDGNLTKLFVLEGDRLVKSPRAQWTGQGVIAPISFATPHDFADYLAAGIEGCLVPGISPDGEPMDIGTLSNPIPSGKRRCKADLTYAPAFPLLIDIDHGGIDDPLILWERILGILPEAKGAAWVAIPSTSTWLFAPSGAVVKGGGKWHLYIMANGGDRPTEAVANFRALLKHRDTAKLIDLSPLQAAQPHYEAAPELPTGYTQRKPAPVVSDGLLLNLEALPSPPKVERPTVTYTPVDGDIDRDCLNEIVEFLRGVDFAPGTGTYGDLLKLTAALVALVGESEAIAIGEMLAPTRGNSTIASMCRRPPSQGEPMGTIVNVAKAFGWGGYSPELGKRIAQSLNGDRPFVRLSPTGSPQPAAADSSESAIARAVAWRNSQVRSLANAEAGYFDPIPYNPQGDRTLAILNGQVKTGKTSTGIASIAVAAKALGLNTLKVDPTNILCENSAAGLGGVAHTDEARCKTAHFLVCSPESLAKFPTGPEGKPWDVVILDEPNDGIERVQTGELGNTPKESRAALKAILAAAHTVVLAQDELRSPIVDSVANWGNFTPSQIQWHERRRPPSEMRIKWYQSQPYDPEEEEGRGKTKTFDQQLQFIGEIMRCAREDKPTVLSTGSQAFGRRVARLVRSLYPDKKVIVIDGKDTPSKRRRAMAVNPDGFIRDNAPDLLIFTPTLNSGVSINTDYFEAVFEYISPFETASSAWQRGSRVRKALGGGKVTERHIFLQQCGLSKIPPVEVFTAEYWASAIQRNATLTHTGLTTELTSLGLPQPAIASILSGQLGNAALDEPALPKLLAINAIEIYAKREILHALYADAGWDVDEVPAVDGKTFAELSKQWKEATLSIENQRGRIAAKACSLIVGERRKPTQVKAWVNGADCEGPVQAAQFRRWDVEDLYTGDNPLLNDPLWWESWHDDHSPHLRRAKLHTLLTMDAAERARLSQWHALSLVTKRDPRLPQLDRAPVSFLDLAYIDLLLTCPHFLDVAKDQEKRHNKDSPEVKAIAQWSREHDGELSGFSRHSQLIKGFQFTDKTPDVKCVHRLLETVGVLAYCVKRGNGKSEYALMPEGEPLPDEAIAPKPQSKVCPLKQRRKLRKLYRLSTAPQVRESMRSLIETRLDRVSRDLDCIALAVKALGESVRTSVVEKITVTEVLTFPPQQAIAPPPPTPPEETPPIAALNAIDGIEATAKAVRRFGWDVWEAWLPLLDHQQWGKIANWLMEYHASLVQA